MRVAVIGLGIVGANVSQQLARRGVDVVMLDAAPPGAGVSQWSFSWVNASHKTQTRSYFELSTAGVVAYHELAQRIGGSGWWHPTGHLRWVATEPERQALRQEVDLLTSWGYGAAWWSAGRVRRLLEPDVRFEEDEVEVAFFADEGWVAGKRLVTRLVEDALRHDASLHVGRPVVDIAISGDRVTGVTLADGQHHEIDAVVNAAGPDSESVARLVGRGLPMRDEPGLAARFHCDRVPVRRAMHAPRVELRPDGGGGRVLIHSREIDALISPDVDADDLASPLQGLAAEVVPALARAKLLGARISQRPIPGDGFPSVGGIDEVSGYYEAVMHSGITLGPVVGRLLASEIIDGTVDSLLAPYRPGRFPVASVGRAG